MQFTLTSQSASAQNPTVFNFNGSDLRVFDRKGEPWFVASDIASLFGISSIRARVQNLDDDERCNLKLQRGGEISVVSESGMWTLVLRSDSALKKDTPAYKARKWVTSEVLPAIRKTGQYSTTEKSSEVATLTPAQQLAIQQAVGRRAQKTANHYQTIYRAIKLRYQIAKYDQLPQSLFEDCLKFIETVDLHVPEAQTPTQETTAIPVQPQRDILTRTECERLLGFVYEFRYLHKPHMDAIYDLLKAVKSPLAPGFWELKESWSIRNLERVLAAHGYKVQDLDCYKHLMNA